MRWSVAALVFHLGVLLPAFLCMFPRGTVCCEFAAQMAPPHERGQGEGEDRREVPPPGGFLFASVFRATQRGKCALIILFSIFCAVALSTLCVAGGQGGDCGAVAVFAPKDISAW